MCKAVVFAGTSEGREISEHLADCGVSVCVCVATEYGHEISGAHENIQIHTGNMDAEEMNKFIEPFAYVIDATHPYASLATKNIKQACEEGEKPYYRLLRPGCTDEGCMVVDSAGQAAEFLRDKEGNILLTTGSKDLDAYKGIDVSRLYPRVLPVQESLEKCKAIGISQKNIICMQGPFSVQLNRAMIEQVGAKYLVTKDSGDVGGYPEKVEAARQTGAILVVIRRPLDESGYDMESLKKLLYERYDVKNISCAAGGKNA